MFLEQYKDESVKSVVEIKDSCFSACLKNFNFSDSVPPVHMKIILKVSQKNRKIRSFEKLNMSLVSSPRQAHNSVCKSEMNHLSLEQRQLMKSVLLVKILFSYKIASFQS